MRFEEALELVRSFWPQGAGRFGPGDQRQLDRLEREYGRTLPAELRAYLAAYGPRRNCTFEAVGNPIELYAPRQLAARATGYNWNPMTRCQIEGWSEEWVLIGDEGADPIIIDLGRQSIGDSCPVLQAPHGQGEWDFTECAPSLSVFLVLVAAQHHALTGIVRQVDAITDDEHGFNLCAAAAKWFFPFVRRVAPQYYDRWTSVFDNASASVG